MKPGGEFPRATRNRGDATVRPRRRLRGATSLGRTDLAGVVLAGGRSRRMGRNKATLRAGGELLWRRQSRILKEAGARPVLLALRPRQRSLGRSASEIRDRWENAGPLAGLHAALTASPAPLLMVLAVDMPRADASWFRRLLRRCRAGRGAVFVGPSGPEPLAAVYPREALGEATRRLHRGQLAVREFVTALVRSRRLAVLRLTRRELPQCANWNRPADLPRSGRRKAPGPAQAWSKPTARATSS